MTRMNVLFLFFVSTCNKQARITYTHVTHSAEIFLKHFLFLLALEMFEGRREEIKKGWSEGRRERRGMEERRKNKPRHRTLEFVTAPLSRQAAKMFTETLLQRTTASFCGILPILPSLVAILPVILLWNFRFLWWF